MKTTAVLTNPKRRLGVILMALSFLPLSISFFYLPLHRLFSLVLLFIFVSGSMLNYLGWKEEKKVAAT